MDRAELLTRLAELEAAAAADVMVAMGLDAQVLASDLRPLGRSKLAGFALCASGRDDTDEAGLPTFALDDLVTPDAVVVIDTGRCGKGAIIGDNMVTSMISRGARGFVLDGGIRDRDALASASVPVWCRYASPINAHRKWKYVSMNAPITMPGVWGDVVVNPGDLILADEDGLCVLPAEHAEQIIRDTEVHMRSESGIRAQIEAGTSRKSATKSAGRLAHVRPLTSDAEIPQE
ncbi:MAG: RraA family protein [Hyphomonas sp.]